MSDWRDTFEPFHDICNQEEARQGMRNSKVYWVPDAATIADVPTLDEVRASYVAAMTALHGDPDRHLRDFDVMMNHVGLEHVWAGRDAERKHHEGVAADGDLDTDAIRLRHTDWYNRGDDMQPLADWPGRDSDETIEHYIVRQDVPALLDEIARLRSAR